MSPKSPVTRVDTIVQQEDLPQPTVAKIDVEGAELQVLDGVKKRSTRAENCSSSPTHDHVDVDEVITTTDAGFDVTTLKERGNTEFLWATTPGAESSPQ